MGLEGSNDERPENGYEIGGFAPSGTEIDSVVRAFPHPMLRRHLLILLATSACGQATRAGSPTQDPPPHYQSVLIENVPHLRQRPDFCGEACVAMMAAKLRGAEVAISDQDAVFDASGLDPSLGRGCYTAELREAMQALGFDPGPVWAEFEPEAAGIHLERAWAELHADLRRDMPSIVCMHFDGQPETTEHFRLVLGYDADTDEVVFHDPALDDGAYQRLGRAAFLKLWPLGAAGTTQVTIRLSFGGSMSDLPGAVGGPRPADYAQRVLQLRERLADDGLHVRLERPFVVVGDQGEEKLAQYSEGTIRWAVEKLTAQYFEKPPNEIVDIYLFGSDRSYRKFARKLFDDEPDTPYGYYSPTHEALVMNIATGGGTLVHELVHPFMAANFPACPSWFNEGLASLYEQSASRGGKIVGLTNWRLPGLQEAIRDGDVPSFRRLCASGERPFYDEDPGTNYAQARYLCFWLQEHGLLERFYRQFRAAAARDPGGFHTLEKVVGTSDMVEFQDEWEKYVMRLTV
jgi:hypothetical protein